MPAAASTTPTARVPASARKTGVRAAASRASRSLARTDGLRGGGRRSAPCAGAAAALFVPLTARTSTLPDRNETAIITITRCRAAAVAMQGPPIGLWSCVDGPRQGDAFIYAMGLRRGFGMITQGTIVG